MPIKQVLVGLQMLAVCVPIYGPGATTGNADQRRQYANCSVALGSWAFASVGLIADNKSSTYHALQVAFSRQFTSNFSFLASYWWSKSLDYLSSLNLSGSAPTLVAGENDLASPEFSQILQASAPRLLQLAVKFFF